MMIEKYSEYAPVLLFVYNRPIHTKRILSSLEACDGKQNHDLFIFADGMKDEASEENKKNIVRVRKIIKRYESSSTFKNCVCKEAYTNKGLANSIIQGVSDIISRYGTVIVLEDDLIVKKDFLDYMQRGLEYYRRQKKVGAISGFTFSIPKIQISNHDVYMSKTGNSWGWATWVDRWVGTDWDVKTYQSFKDNVKKRAAFDKTQAGISKMLDMQMNGEIDSWAVRWDYSFFLRGLYTIYPKHSRIINTGLDGSGVHCSDIGKNIGRFELYEQNKHLEYKDIDKLMDYTKITSEYSSGEGEMIQMIRKLKTGVKRIIRGGAKVVNDAYSSVSVPLSTRLVKSAYKSKLKSEWTYSNKYPEFFDHRIDLYYQWEKNKDIGWIERGIYSSTALSVFKNPIVLEMCCGDGFNSYFFYSGIAEHIIACDLSDAAIDFAQVHYKCQNIDYISCDIIKNMPEYKIKYTNIVWDAAIAYFDKTEIQIIIENAKKLSDENVILSGSTNTEAFSYHKTVFHDAKELASLLKQFFENVYIFETKHVKRDNLYFFASDGDLPFSHGGILL